MPNTDTTIDLDGVLDRTRTNSQVLPKAALAACLWVADCQDQLIADLEDQINNNIELLDAMVENCP